MADLLSRYYICGVKYSCFDVILIGQLLGTAPTGSLMQRTLVYGSVKGSMECGSVLQAHGQCNRSGGIGLAGRATAGPM